MTDWDFYLHYLGTLVALSEAREQRDRLAAALQRERNELYVEYGVKGYTAVGELDDLWDEWMLPILELAHLPMERPWAKAVRKYQKRRTWKHGEPNGADAEGVRR